MNKRKKGMWEVMFQKLVGDLALFVYHLQPRFPQIRLVPEEYPNDIDHLPVNCARLLVVTEYETEVDPKKVRDKPHVLYNLNVAGVLSPYDNIRDLRSWNEPEKYKEVEKKINKAVAKAFDGREFYLKIGRNDLKKMREDIAEYGLGLYFNNNNPLGIGMQVELKGEPIKGYGGFSANSIRLPLSKLFPEGTPERKYFDSIFFWNRFWKEDVYVMARQGVVLDAQASWRSCRLQIHNCRRVIADILALEKKDEEVFSEI